MVAVSETIENATFWKDFKSSCVFKNILWTRNRCFRRFWSWWWRRLRTKRRDKLACCLLRFSSQHNTRVIFDTSADRKVGSVIVCDHMETTLFTIVCDRLRSPAIIWKPALRKSTAGDVMPDRACVAQLNKRQSKRNYFWNSSRIFRNIFRPGSDFYFVSCFDIITFKEHSK